MARETRQARASVARASIMARASIENGVAATPDITFASAGSVTAYYKMHLHTKTEWDLANRLDRATNDLGLIVIENRVRAHFGYTFYTYYFCDAETKFPLVCEPKTLEAKQLADRLTKINETIISVLSNRDGLEDLSIVRWLPIEFGSVSNLDLAILKDIENEMQHEISAGSRYAGMKSVQVENNDYFDLIPENNG